MPLLAPLITATLPATDRAVLRHSCLSSLADRDGFDPAALGARGAAAANCGRSVGVTTGGAAARLSNGARAIPAILTCPSP